MLSEGYKTDILFGRLYNTPLLLPWDLVGDSVREAEAAGAPRPVPLL